MAEELIADRFLFERGPWGLDLATGARVWLRVEAIASAGDDQNGAWAERCAALSVLWHPALAPCLDYGTIGTAARFEAYGIEPGVHEIATNPRQAVAAFLHAAGLSPGTLILQTIAGVARVLPGAFATQDDPRPRSPLPSVPLGLRIVAQPALRAVEEALGDEPRPGLSALAIGMPARGGGRTLLRQAAALGRRAGWLPISTASVPSWSLLTAAMKIAWFDRLSGRHVLVLHDGRAHGPPEAALASLSVARVTTRPCLLLYLVPPGRDRGALECRPLGAHELIESVVAPPLPAAIRRQVRRAAGRAGGRPGAFVDALWPRFEPMDPVVHALPYRVHESRSEFGVEPAPEWSPLPTSIGAERQPRAREAPAIDTAIRLAGRGRRAAAERWLRRAAARLARRGLPADAAETLLACADLAWRRGRAGDALELLEQARDAADRARDPVTAIRVALRLGRAHLEMLGAEASEAVLRSACTAAEVTGDTIILRRARAALAHTLWWRGRAEDAAPLCRTPARASSRGEPRAATAPAPRNDDLALLSIFEHGIAARIACLRGRYEAAAAHVQAAIDCADDAGTELARLAALAVRARWLAWVRDTHGLLAMIPEAVGLARRLERPLEAWRLRALALEACVTRTGPCGALARSLRHVSRRRLPPLLAARVELALAAGDGRDAPLLRDRLVRLGFGAFARRAPAAVAIHTTRSPMVHEVIAVIQTCQENEDPAAALRDLAEALRRRLSAHVVSIISEGPAPALIAAPATERKPVASVRRALEGGVFIEPHPSELGLECAAPARHGGRLVGAVGCRWRAGTSHDDQRIVHLLTAAAAAAGPCLRAMVESAERPVAPQIAADLTGVSPAMEEVRRTVARAADAPFNVLVQGESGVGKELVARALHRSGPRRTRPFCAINCAALPDDLLEAELFGHVRGVFTGAVTDRRGLFEEADGGVLFLDEVGELSGRGQAKLLRVLQEHEVRRIGDAHPRRVDVRIVAATNRCLDREVEAGGFRRDLWYRLDVIRIRVPPLRERPEDVPVLALALWPQAADRVGSRARLSDATLAALARYDWPGNVRELQNVLAALAVGAQRRGAIAPSALPAAIARATVEEATITLDQARRRFEERFVRAALARAGGHRGRAAAALGLTRQGLAKLLGRLRLDEPAARDAPPA